MWLVLAVVYFLISGGDHFAACGEAAPPHSEWGIGQMTLLPPRYECATTTQGNYTAPLDTGGWIDWTCQMLFPVLLLIGFVMVLVQVLNRGTARGNEL